MPAHRENPLWRCVPPRATCAGGRRGNTIVSHGISPALSYLDTKGVASKFGPIQPHWPAGLPSRFIDNLQLAPDAVLAIFRTDSIRLGAEHYVNRFDHLVLFSPRHPLGLEVARIGIDDGNVLDWRFEGGKLWLKTSDDRGDAPKAFAWSLDLSSVL